MRLYNEDLTKCNFDKSFLPKLMLYPAELQAQKKSTRIQKKQKIVQASRTHDLLVR